MAKATLLYSFKRVFDDGAILQAKLWLLPHPERVRGSGHNLKYSLFYGREGERILAYDNEAGKGDHVHRQGVETPYQFASAEKMVQDFLNEVVAIRGGPI